MAQHFYVNTIFNPFRVISFKDKSDQYNNILNKKKMVFSNVHEIYTHSRTLIYLDTIPCIYALNIDTFIP